MGQLIQFIVYLVISYVLVWVQLYGQTKWVWIQNNIWWFMYCLTLPIAYLLTKGTMVAYSHFQSSAWAVTFISFAINIFIFALMNFFVNGEGINMKTGICLALCVSIICVQAFWK
jgi:hypothetical protein